MRSDSQPSQVSSPFHSTRCPTTSKDHFLSPTCSREITGAVKCRLSIEAVFLGLFIANLMGRCLDPLRRFGKIMMEISGIINGVSRFAQDFMCFIRLAA